MNKTEHETSILPPQTDSEPVTPAEVTGLCVNCDKREYCLHCRQLGGVWFCEEYE